MEIHHSVSDLSGFLVFVCCLFKVICAFMLHSPQLITKSDIFVFKP